MNMIQTEHAAPTMVLSPVSTRGMLALGILTVATVVLPPVCHIAGVPVRWVLPMHWPVVLAALVYGWRGGAVVGVLAPLLSYVLSGYPLPPKIPPMTIELMAYGALIGIFREKLRFNGFMATGLGLVIGRLLFLGVILATAANEVPFGQYLMVAMVPGLLGAGLQTALLPPLAAKWVKSGKH